MRRAAAGLVSLLLPLPASAQPARDPGLLVSVQWLKTHLQDKNLVILAIGPSTAYGAGHVPGARAVTTQDIIARPPADPVSSSVSMMLPEQVLKETLEQRLGISSDSRIVVVTDSGWVSLGTRLVLTLQYAGLGARASLLDGGAPAWRKAGYPESRDVPPAPTPGHITNALFAKALVVDHLYVAAHAHAANVRLIDARVAAYFNLANPGGTQGHIPGAASIPMEAVLDDNGFFRPTQELETLFRSAGVQPGDTVVAYCQNGFRSTAVILAARILGNPVRNYDGSWRDWGLRKLPTEGGR